MGYYLLLLYWALRGALFLSKGLFRGCDRDLLLPLAAKVGKNAIQTCGLKIRPRYTFQILIPYPTRSQNRFHVVPYDELTSLLRRCRSLLQR